MKMDVCFAIDMSNSIESSDREDSVPPQTCDEAPNSAGKHCTCPVFGGNFDNPICLPSDNWEQSCKYKAVHAWEPEMGKRGSQYEYLEQVSPGIRVAQYSK